MDKGQTSAPMQTVNDQQPHAAEANVVAGAAAPAGHVVVRERYCGGLSWLIGICCLFPCIACCPVDKRDVQPRGAVVAGAAAPPGHVVVRENYCGGLSWFIGICCLFPCIGCCPVDKRDVVQKL
ncbi:hypothetical protein JKP88DRAFT_280274 [Tribonema minus]|uniref:Uncharacterized protein n=1 Tax=Tribonema minus TaxID=303371 RepID=A0A835YT45_9STRA|nr:hypothetical protein JKP88DRAFT_280274 [Tribonema minus]